MGLRIRISIHVSSWCSVICTGRIHCFFYLWYVPRIVRSAQASPTFNPVPPVSCDELTPISCLLCPLKNEGLVPSEIMCERAPLRASCKLLDTFCNTCADSLCGSDRRGFLSSAFRDARSEVAAICTAIAARAIQMRSRMRGLDVPHGVAAWSAWVVPSLRTP